MATNTDLAHELTSWGQGPKHTALMRIIIAYYEIGPEKPIALNQTHLCNCNCKERPQRNLRSCETWELHFCMACVLGTALLRRHSTAGFGIRWKPSRRCSDKIRESSSVSFGWLWGKIAEELRERRHDLNYENMGQGLKSSPPAQLALPAPSTGDPKATKVTKTKVSAKKDTRPAAAASTEEPQRHTCALHAAGFCRFRVNCRNSHVGKPGWEEVRKAYSDAQKSKPKGAEKGSKGEGRERRKTTRAPKVALEFRQQWLRAASIVMVIEVEGRQAHGNPSVSFVTRPFFLGTCSWSCPFPSWPHWFHPSPTPMNKLESKLRLQWCTLRFRISRSIHWSFWEPLELPMASEVSGRCRTRDLAGKWWSHGQNF